MKKEPIDIFIEIITYPVALIDKSGLPRIVRFLLFIASVLIILPFYIPLFIIFGIWECWNLTAK